MRYTDLPPKGLNVSILNLGNFLADLIKYVPLVISIRRITAFSSTNNFCFIYQN